MPYSKLQINWQGSSATLETDAETDAGPITVTFFRIELAREDVLKSLPKGYDLPQQQPAPGPQRKRGGGLRKQRKRGGGRPEQYEWDRVVAEFVRLLEDEGWPQIQSYREFAKKVCDACAEAGMEPTPSVDTVREKMSIWNSARRR